MNIKSNKFLLMIFHPFKYLKWLKSCNNITKGCCVESLDSYIRNN